MDKNNNKNTTKTNAEQQRFIDEQAKLIAANRILSIRLRLSIAFHTMWIKAFDALLQHQVNVRSLPAYKDSTMLDRALDGDVAAGESSIMEYIKRVENEVTAAVRRKQFRKV